MNEKDPFEKYDKLFDEQDKKHDQQVKEYRRESKLEDKPSFDNFKEDDFDDSKQTSQSGQAVGLFISVVVGIVILRSIFSSSTSFINVFTLFIIIGITSSIYKYFKNKR